MQYLNRNSSKNLLVFGCTFAVIGIMLLLISAAATGSNIRLESEYATKSGSTTDASGQTDVSGGAYTSLNTATTSTTRDIYKWPFSKYSIWNMPVGTGAQLVDANIADPTDRLLYSDGDVIVLDPNAPQRQVQAVTGDLFWDKNVDQLSYRCNPNGGTLGTVLIPNGFVTTREGATPNAAGALLRPDKMSILDTQPFSACSNGAYTSAYWNDVIQLNSDGAYGSHGGSGLSALGGTIRNHELAANYPRDGIKHALKMVLYENDNLNCDPVPYSLDENCARWPARVADGYAHPNSCPSAQSQYCGSNSHLKPGSLLILEDAFNIETLSSEIGKRIAWTLKNYGAYVVDAAGWKATVLQLEMGPSGVGKDIFQQQWGMSFEGSMNDRSSNPWLSDYYKMLKSLKIVTNNGPNSIGGGGTPKQSFAPPFANGISDGITTNPNQ
jgi:hypothetical protein